MFIRMRLNLWYLLKVFISILCLVLYCEFFVYYFILIQCKWPMVEPNNAHVTFSNQNENAVRAMVFADTHLLGPRKGHWFDKLRREWQMYRAFQTAMLVHHPEVVFLLGDVTDEGDFCSEVEFNHYVKRFYSTFAVPSDTIMYIIVGNHDIGFHYRITPYFNNRFMKGFNSSAVQFITIKDNHFILLNSMALEGDGCFLCRSTELQLTEIEKTLKCVKHKDVCKTSDLHYSQPILMQHFPLYRESDEDCNEPDEAPPPLKSKKYREGWDCLTQGSTYQLLKQLEPRLVISGHTHYGCTRNLTYGKGIEITLPSFSWRNTNIPSYGLFIFEPNNYAFSKCLMPRESTIISCYVFGGLWILVGNQLLYLGIKLYQYILRYYGYRLLRKVHLTSFDKRKMT